MLEGCPSTRWLHNSFCLFQGVNLTKIVHYVYVMDLTTTQSGKNKNNEKKKKKKKKKKSSSVTRVTGGVVTPKDKTKLLLQNPFALILCLNAKIE